MDSEFRPLSTRERDLMEKLLDGRKFPGRDELRCQLHSLTVKTIINDGTLELRCGPNPPAPNRGLVTEGECKDATNKKFLGVVFPGSTQTAIRPSEVMNDHN